VEQHANCPAAHGKGTVELEPGERRIDHTRERHQLRGDPIVKNVALADILTPVLEQDLAALAPPPALLPRECIERYELMRQAILSDIAPKSAIEWLLAVDVVELSWDIERYRLLRHKVLKQYREQAIEQCLRQIDLPEISSKSDGLARQQIRRNAWCWRNDKGAAHEIESRLAAHGFDQSSISAESLAQAREFFFVFQTLLDTAQSRRMSLLREVKFHRAEHNWRTR
jgi:hypothetical protein